MRKGDLRSERQAKKEKERRKDDSRISSSSSPTSRPLQPQNLSPSLSSPLRAAPRASSAATCAALPDGEIDVAGDAKDKMLKSVQATQESFNSVRTGRANASMLDRVEVDYFGTLTPLKSLAGISTPDASSLAIQPYDLSAMALIEKAITNCADLGMTPSNDGKQIRLNVPPLTADRRKEMAKLVSKLGEEGKVAVRNVRKIAMKTVDAMLKDKVISEDRKKTLDKSIQALTDESVKKVEGMVKAKQEEITKV